MRKDFTDLPGLVQITANTHIAMLEKALPGRLDSYWVVGSAALGDFVEGKSDVDFIAVTREPLKPDEIAALERIHRLLHGKPMLAGLDGFYVPHVGLGGDWQAFASCPRFNEGKYHGLKPFGINSPDGWTLRQYGVLATDAGPEPSYPVDWDKLLQGMAANLNTYWRKWTRDSRGFTPRGAGLLLNPDAAEWGVLGICRLYYTFRERDVSTKTGAGEYALQCLPEQWHAILREALDIRRGGWRKFAPSLHRRWETLALMEFMLDECARVYQGGGN